MSKTNYHLKKEFYAFVLSQNLDKLLMCNVNERILISSINGESLFSSYVKVEEQNESLFNITCSGASLSQD